MECIEIASENKLSPYQLNMISSNMLHWLLKVKVSGKKSLPKFLYDVSGLIQLKVYLESNKLSGKIIGNIVIMLQNIEKDLEEYLLFSNNIVWDVDKIYIDEGDSQVYFMYMPVKVNGSDNFNADKEKFMNMLRGYIDKKSNVEEVINHIETKTNLVHNVSNVNYAGSDIIHKAVHIINKLIITEIIVTLICVANFYKQTHMIKLIGIIFILITIILVLLKHIIESYSTLGEDELGIIEDIETLVIRNYPILKKKNSLEKQFITGDKFSIGKSETSDLRIIKNSAISKMHAIIYYKKDGYYLKDLESRNGTFVNDIKLELDEEVLLVDGDKITFGNVVYYYYE